MGFNPHQLRRTPPLKLSGEIGKVFSTVRLWRQRAAATEAPWPHLGAPRGLDSQPTPTFQRSSGDFLQTLDETNRRGGVDGCTCDGSKTARARPWNKGARPASIGRCTSVQKWVKTKRARLKPLSPRKRTPWGPGYPRECLRHRVKIGLTLSFTPNFRGESFSPTYVRGQS